jgi:hypothetical protein
VRRSAVPLILATATLAAPAAAQTRWERQVQQQLGVITRDLEPRGFHPAGRPFTGELSAGRQATFRVGLRAGLRYAIVGLCDEDCRDLRLRVLDEHDAEVAATTAWSATPLIEVAPPSAGKYRVVVVMAHCGTGPCAYGVGIYSKPEDPPTNP